MLPVGPSFTQNKNGLKVGILTIQIIMQTKPVLTIGFTFYFLSHSLQFKL